MATAIEHALMTAGGTRTDVDGGPVDVVVHVADCSGARRALIDVDEDAWDAAAEAPVRALLKTLQRAHPVLVSDRGRLVVVLPAAALEGATGLVAEATGWEAMRVLAKSAARRWVDDGVTVNVVCVPLDAHHGDSHAVADSVVLFARLEAAHLTGATVVVDGGQLMLP
jgi:3-oxoacyl-[acyl-carrier protein] reductase